MRENGHQPFGLPPENSVCCVAALEHGTTMPRALRLATTIFRGNGGMNNVETASNNYAARPNRSSAPLRLAVYAPQV